MTTPQVVRTSVTVSINSPIQVYPHPDDNIPPTDEMTFGLTEIKINTRKLREKL